MQINDRITLGLVAGLAGNVAKMAVDEASLRLKISQKSYRSTAAGVWVREKKDADTSLGQLLGVLLDFGLGSLGGVAIVATLSKTGRDHILAKGVFSGITIGSVTTALVSALPQNRVRPTDAASNLSYMLAHAVYGAVTTTLAAKVGHPSLFDAQPVNDYLSPTEPTTEEVLPGRQ